MVEKRRRRLRSSVLLGDMSVLLVLREVGRQQYAVTRESLGSAQEIIHAGGYEECVAALETTRQQMLTNGYSLGPSWEGAGSAEHEVTRYMRATSLVLTAGEVIACSRFGEVSYRGGYLTETQVEVLIRALKVPVMTGKLLRLQVTGQGVEVVEVLSGETSSTLLQAEVQRAFRGKPAAISAPEIALYRQEALCFN